MSAAGGLAGRITMSAAGGPAGRITMSAAGGLAGRMADLHGPDLAREPEFADSSYRPFSVLPKRPELRIFLSVIAIYTY